MWDLPRDGLGMSRWPTLDFNGSCVAVGKTVKARTKPRLLAMFDADRGERTPHPLFVSAQGNRFKIPANSRGGATFYL
jgi:hypothetical protein